MVGDEFLYVALGQFFRVSYRCTRLDCKGCPGLGKPLQLGLSLDLRRPLANVCRADDGVVCEASKPRRVNLSGYHREDCDHVRNSAALHGFSDCTEYSAVLRVLHVSRVYQVDSGNGARQVNQAGGYD